MTSWIASANAPDNNFPLQNLPYGVIARPGEPARCAVAIGEFALDLAALEGAGLLKSSAFGEPGLKRLHGARPGGVDGKPRAHNRLVAPRAAIPRCATIPRCGRGR